MNHYERLKVNPDAPIEVIRAAYRALAAKHHPDRHTQPGSSHGDMAALNGAYEVLADPIARQAYDTELAEAAQAPQPVDSESRLQNFWRSTMAFGQSESPDSTSADNEQDESRVDVQWQPAMPAEVSPWLQKKRLAMLAGGVGCVALIAGAWWLRSTMLQVEAEQTLSKHYGGQLGATTLAVKGGLPLPAASAVAAMTDEELLAQLSSLTGQEIASSPSVNRHLLDGSPLTLRTDTKLVDPSATPQTAKPAHP